LKGLQKFRFTYAEASQARSNSKECDVWQIVQAAHDGRLAVDRLKIYRQVEYDLEVSQVVSARKTGQQMFENSTGDEEKWSPT
jgi:hypothetical protein